MPDEVLSAREVEKRFGVQDVGVWIPIYNVGMFFVYGPRENLEAYARYRFDDPTFEILPVAYRGLHLCKSGYVSIVWMPAAPKTPEEVGTLAHELMHVVRRLFGVIGIPLNKETDEAYCYVFGYLVKEVLERIGCTGVTYAENNATNTKRKVRNRVLAEKRLEAGDSVRNRRAHAGRVVSRPKNRGRRRQAH